MTAIYIYAKRGKIKALSEREVKEQKAELIEKGWVFKANLAPSYLEYLHNDCPDIEREIKSLSK